MGEAVGESIPGRLLAHLNLGVTIFFLISGFLLYRPFIADRGGGAAAPGIGDYARRRFLRIYPAYSVVITVLTIVPGVTGVEGDQGVAQ
jgi:peptidoglycan/LPS O-acetylase OafA/YrhL